MAKHIHVHVHDSQYNYNGTYDPKDEEKWKRVWRLFNRDSAPIPLDEDLEQIARGKPGNVIADIYELQAQRDRDRSRRFIGPSIFDSKCACKGPCGCKK